MNSIHKFADSDVETINVLKQWFCHVTDPNLVNMLAKTLFGARWIYKVGLALMVKEEKQAAHVRAQIIDYSSICELLLLNMIDYAITNNKMTNNKHTKGINGKALTWTASNNAYKLGKQGFCWLIDVAKGESIISGDLPKRLHSMRKMRNGVHLISKTFDPYVGTCKKIYETIK